MVTTESVTIKVPVGMSKYLVTMTPEMHYYSILIY